MELVKPFISNLRAPIVDNLVKAITDAKLNITDVVIFGASIMEQSFSNTSDVESKFLEEGYTINVHERATSGDNTTQMLTRLPAVITEFQAIASTTLFAIHWGGNDVSQEGAYPAAAGMEINMRSMLNDIRGAGFKIMMSDISYRVPPASNPTQPYNDAFMYQLQSEYNDVDWFLYQLTFDNQANIEPDGIHPDPVLENLIRQELVDRSKTKIKPNFTVSVPNLTEVFIEFGDEVLMSRDSTTNRVSGNGTIFDIRNKDYSTIASSSLTVSGATSINNVGRGNTSDPTNDTISLFNNDCLTDSLFVQSPDTMSIDLSSIGLVDSDLYTVGLTASRADTSGTKVTDYTINNVTKSLDSELNPPAQVYFNNVSGADLKSSGISIKAQSGSSFGYVSILQIVKEN